MTLYFIVLTIVGAFTAYFYGVSTSLEVGKNLTELWILAGFLIAVLNPVFNLMRAIFYLLKRAGGFFHSLTAFLTHR